AIFVLAMFMTQVIEMPQRMVAQISTPIISEAWKNKEKWRIEELYKKSAVNLFVIGALLFLLIWGSIDEIFVLTPKTEIYRLGKTVVFCLGITKVFDMATGLHSEIIQYSKYYNFTIFSVLLLGCMTIFFNYQLIPVYGIDGAAYAYLVAYLLYAIVKVTFIWFAFGLHPFSKQTWVILAISGMIFSINYLIRFPLTDKLFALLSIILRSLLTTAFFAVCIYFLKISPDINRLTEKGLAFLKKKTG
ncbi:MAG: polysaccharide biosynthesis C-terminal domain-containing protein, partial [Verrucomicrobia bacterium]|nr:polysaccharide biosynthesis C-terminal domain-containing protein [Cytophagales bacterium]